MELGAEFVTLCPSKKLIDNLKKNDNGENSVDELERSSNETKEGKQI
jgi:hypothetical protein